MTVMIVLYGFLFGAILQSAKLNRFDIIGGMATLVLFFQFKLKQNR
jgi:hypothetical protein